MSGQNQRPGDAVMRGTQVLGRRALRACNGDHARPCATPAPRNASADLEQAPAARQTFN